MHPQMPSTDQLVQNARAELDLLLPRIKLAEALVPKVEKCANSIYKSINPLPMNPEAIPESPGLSPLFAVCQACMVLLECQLTNMTLQLEEMVNRKKILEGFLASAGRRIVLGSPAPAPGPARKV
jgi:hypothetical protein